MNRLHVISSVFTLAASLQLGGGEFREFEPNSGQVHHEIRRPSVEHRVLRVELQLLVTYVGFESLVGREAIRNLYVSAIAAP